MTIIYVIYYYVYGIALNSSTLTRLYRIFLILFSVAFSTDNIPRE